MQGDKHLSVDVLAALPDKSIGFNSDFNEVFIFYKDKNINDEKLNVKKKSEISNEIINRVVNHLN